MTRRPQAVRHLTVVYDEPRWMRLGNRLAAIGVTVAWLVILGWAASVAIR